MLAASQLTRRFGSRLAVDGVSITLHRGEILALLGPNGAGKTTTLRMLAGLIPPTSGTVAIDGQALTTSTHALRGRIGFLTEAPGLWDRLPVRENLLVHARLQGVDRPSDAVARSLASFGIEDRASDRPAELSKGLRQRVALARTLLHDPRVVLLDEPTSGLDPESARDVRALIRGMRADGRAVLISTHNLDEVERVADRVAVIRSRLIALDTPQALRGRLFGRRVRIVLHGAAAPFEQVLRREGVAHVEAEGETLLVKGPPGATGPTTPDLVRWLVGAGAPIEAVVPDEPSIEEVYLQIVAADGAGGDGATRTSTGAQR